MGLAGLGRLKHEITNSSEGGKEGRREIHSVVPFLLSCMALADATVKNWMPASVHWDPSGGGHEAA